MKLIDYSIHENSVQLTTDNALKLRVQTVGADILRISCTKREFCDTHGDIVIATSDAAAPMITEFDDRILIGTEKIQLEIRRHTCAMRFLRGEQELLRLSDRPLQLLDTTVTVPHHTTKGGDGTHLTQLPTENLPGYRFYLSMALDKDEHIHGLGQYGLGTLDRRESPVELYQMNNTAPVPFFVSSRGWGIFVDTGAYSTFSRDIYGTTFYTDAVDMGDFYFCGTDSIDGAIAAYRRLTGSVPMMPKWLFGYAQSKEHYHTQAEILDVLHEYRRREVPLDLIVQDWNYWREGTWSDKSFDPARYPDPTGMCEDIHQNHAHVMISVWPNTRGGDNFRELYEKDQLLTDDGTFGGGSVYNVFDDDACATYAAQLENVRRHGFDAWWCDATEPFEQGYGDRITAEELKWRVMPSYRRFFDSRKINLFSLLHAKNVYNYTRRAEDEGKRVVNLTRSGYAGQQRYGAIVWSGDIGGSYEELKKQIAEGLNYCASGLPYWTLDIGGFFPSHGEATFNSGVPYRAVSDPGYRELYVRWLQFGCFLPVMRSHGTTFPREIWRFGEAGEPFYDAILKFVRLRYTLMPYIYSTAWQVTAHDATFIRLLASDFPHDARALTEDTTYLFGKSLLVSPVVEPQYYEGADVPLDAPKTKEVYLPDGADWYDFWTGECHKGGQSVIVDTPIDSMPLFVRAGSIIPTSPVMQYVDEIPDAPYTITVYPGADADFTLYEDSGDGYAYERGAYAEVDFHWDDGSHTLTVSARKGDFPTLVRTRALVLRTVGGEEMTVSYSGEELRVEL